MIRRITIAVLAAALVGAVLAVPALSNGGPAVVAKKKGKKCKKGKKGKKKRKGCKRGSPSGLGGLPGQATPASPTQPDQPPTPPVLHVSSVGVTPSTVLAGNSVTGQVTLDAAAPSGGQVVNLGSSAASVSVPDSVVVSAGLNTASFQVNTTSGVAATSTLTGSIGDSTAGAQLKVVDAPSVASVKLERRCFTLDEFSSNRVTLDVPAPADTLVTLVSGDSALDVPDSVNVPEGSTSAFFTVNALAAIPSVTVTASLGSSEATDTVQVDDPDTDPRPSGLTLARDTVAPGDATTATVTLDYEAPATGTEVTLSSENDSVVDVPPSVTVLPGQLSATFPVAAAPGDTDGVYDITATVDDVTVTETLTISSFLPT